jgi:hypothetical protein
MNLPLLRQKAFERFIGLLLNKSKGDTRTPDQLRQIAARQVVQEARREARINGKSQTGPHFQNTPANAFETMLNRISKIVTNQRLYAELMQRRSFDKVSKLLITPTIIDAPIVCDEPMPVQVRRPADSKDNLITFPVVSGISSAKQLDDAEFPKLGGMADEVRNNWRASCQENLERQKQREIASAAHRAKLKSSYVG